MSRNPDEALAAGPQPSLASRIRLGAGAVAAAALVLFFLQNLQEVEIHFLWFDWTTRMLWALIFSALAGGTATFAVATLRRRGRAEPR